MRLVNKIIKYEIHNAIRNKWIIIYSLFFFFAGYVLFAFSGDPNKMYLSLMNIVLIVIPLVSIIFSSIYLYNSREFIEMMLSQPIDRKALFLGIYLGTTIPLATSFGIGLSLPFFLFGQISGQFDGILLLLSVGIVLTFVFSSIAYIIATNQDDKARGLGLSIIIWMIFAIIYDGLILLVVYYFGEYPLENTMIIMSILNPLDLARILFLLHFDISALMGYTGAVFQNFFGSYLGIAVSSTFLILWIVIPAYISLRVFKRKDF